MPKLTTITGFQEIVVNGNKAHYHGDGPSIYVKARWENGPRKTHLKFRVTYISSENKVVVGCEGIVGIEGGPLGLDDLDAAKTDFATAIGESILAVFVKDKDELKYGF